jgi:hypothetical protein
MQKELVLKAKASDLLAGNEPVADEVLSALQKLFGIESLDEEVELKQSVELFIYEVLNNIQSPKNPYDLGMYIEAAKDLEVLKASMNTPDLPVLSKPTRELLKKYLGNDELFAGLGSINFIPVNKKGEQTHLLPLPIINALNDLAFNVLIYKTINLEAGIQF